jgi:hypothetical protein
VQHTWLETFWIDRPKALGNDRDADETILIALTEDASLASQKSNEQQQNAA